MFDELVEVGIQVDEDMRYYPYRATYDFEAYFKPVEQTHENIRGLKAQHELLSVSLTSNVSRCFSVV